MEQQPSFLTAAEWQSLVQRLKLSSRESDVLAGLLHNANDAQTASELGISKDTVHTYVKRLFLKLQAHTRCGVVTRLFAEYVRLKTLGPNGQAADSSLVTQTGDTNSVN